ncbi:hypothetical protein I3U39_24600 [Mycobacteroides abscessus subsp. abscessus]|nr:hypothetical protein I3U39_24600 [Mycobacteroides abscessus subsp. abscessus]
MSNTYIAPTQNEWDDYTKQRQAERQSARLLIEAITAADPTVSDRDVKTAVKVLDGIRRLDRMTVVALAKTQGLTEIDIQREQHRLATRGVRVSVASDDRLWSIERLCHVKELARQLHHELWNPARREPYMPPGEEG